MTEQKPYMTVEHSECVEMAERMTTLDPGQQAELVAIGVGLQVLMSRALDIAGFHKLERTKKRCIVGMLVCTDSTEQFSDNLEAIRECLQVCADIMTTTDVSRPVMPAKA